MGRIQPLTGGDVARQMIAAAGRLKKGELHTTTQGRVFVENVLSSSVPHGLVASEAAMLALNASSVRGCFPGDFCQRGDLEGDPLAFCISGRGTLAADWIVVSVGNTPPAATADDDIRTRVNLHQLQDVGADTTLISNRLSGILKQLRAGTNITLTPDETGITIAASGGSGGGDDFLSVQVFS